MQGNRLYKSEKLRSHTAVEQLFAQGQSVFVFPLRAQYAVLSAARPGGAAAQFMITIPKRRIRHAVGRMTLRRRVREAYRLCRRELLLDPLQQAGVAVDVALIYLADKPLPYARIDTALREVLHRVATACLPPPDDTPPLTPQVP